MENIMMRCAAAVRTNRAGLGIYNGKQNARHNAWLMGRTDGQLGDGSVNGQRHRRRQRIQEYDAERRY